LSTSTLQVDGNNDLYLVDGRNLGVLRDIDAVVQDVRLQTLQRLGENIYNVNDGVDYFGTMFSNQQSYDNARKSLINAIKASPEVRSVESLSITKAGELLTFEAQASTNFGTIAI